MVRSIALISLLTAVTAASAGTPNSFCASAEMTVEGGDDATRDRICAIVQREMPKLASCHVEVPTGLRVVIEDDLPDDCVGVFHCGEALIRVLSPERMAERRPPDRAFASVPDDAYFDSVVVHELTHAAYDRVKCPFTDCLATTEYAAYAMQVRSLPPDVIKSFAADSEFDHAISRDELNAMYYSFVPDRFAQKAWLHFSQREDGCTLIGQIMDGAVFFDREHF